MRISDWSSDVCSSDLQAINYFVAQKYIEAFKALAEAPNQKFVMMPMESAGVIGSLAGIGELAKETFGQQAGRAVQPPAKIGRASCRERGVRKVWIWVLGVA